MTQAKGKKTVKKRTSDDLSNLVVVFVPSLADILADAERKKGAPLTESEVMNVRDTSTVVMVRRTVADEMVKNRGYRDINPENAWTEWQKVRTQARKG